MTERLRRLDSVFQRTPIYYITTCTYERRSILNNDDVHAQLIEFGKRGASRGAWIGAYVLMPDHLHAFVGLDDERLQMSIWMKSLKNSLSKSLHPQNFRSPHWQKGFFDHVLRNEESYGEKWAYVRNNPVRAGLVKSWREWPFAGEIFDLEFRHDPI